MGKLSGYRVDIFNISWGYFWDILCRFRIGLLLDWLQWENCTDHTVDLLTGILMVMLMVLIGKVNGYADFDCINREQI